MRDFARNFYTSPSWINCRKAYAKSKHNLCERCLAKGIYTTGDIVHHMKHITPENVTDPDITLNWENLELVCRKCHGELHAHERRYEVGPDGSVIF